MVTGGSGDPSGPAPVTESTTVRSGGLGALASRFLYLLPAVLLALICLRVAELSAGFAPGATLTDAARVATPALIGDLLAWLRHLPLLFLLSLPALLLRQRRSGFWVLGATWSVLVALQAALVQYFLIARVPLGADLFAYSWREIGQTAAGGLRLDTAVIVGTVLALLCLWTLLAILARRERYYSPPPRAAALVAGLALAALLFAPKQFAPGATTTEDARNLSLNKAAFFLDDSLAQVVRSSGADEAGDGAPYGAHPGETADQIRHRDFRYPFLRAEQTPDALGAHFNIDPDAPPNLVFVIVEGLGRAFSGPGAQLGSFTPFLDQLAGQSLYWDNFLATQGRTFAVLPSIFGSLPFGEKGFNELGERMPEHATLLSVLGEQGYQLKFFCGTSLDFDDQRTFLQRQGVDLMVDRDDFGSGYTPANDWGYADGELVSRALEAEARDTQQPFVSILQTVSTHTPYTFPGQARYEQRFEERLKQLHITGAEKDKYRAYRDMYASVLYVDDALRRYFEEMQKLPSYGNTIFIVTGDHRLPEIPMATRIDRYHVPFIVFSPLLKSPQRIKSISSHFDIAPSLLAFISHNYRIPTPAAVTWIGSGLDMEPGFRNVHEFPMKQTKTDLVDFVSGTWFLSNGMLYSLGDGMVMEAAENAEARARLEARFAAFRAANNQFMQSLALMPPGTAAQLVSDNAQPRRLLPAAPVVPTAPTAPGISVREVHSPGRSPAGQLVIEAVFANSSAQASEAFIPLIVLLTADGRQVSESYGSSMKLTAGESVTLRLPVTTEGVAAGRYFLAVIPSDPDTGKRLGSGRYHIPVVIDG